MKRRIFFWLEKLKISRAERTAVTILIVLLVILIAANAVISPAAPFDQDRYTALEKEFRRYSAMLLAKEQQRLLRYYPAEMAVSDTLPHRGSSSHRVAPPDGININTSGFNELQRLPGIGPSYAKRIVQYRLSHGLFSHAHELLQVKGIGKARLEKIKPFITLGTADQNITAIAVDSLPLAKIKKSHTPAKNESAIGSFVLNVNKAGQKELQKLPGIGPAYAERIIQYRRENGSFSKKDELLNIKGIGKKRLAKIKPFIKLTGQY